MQGTVEQLNTTLKVIEDPKTSLEERVTLAQSVQQVTVALELIEDTKTPPEVRKYLTKFLEPVGGTLKLINHPKTPPEVRKKLIGILGPLLGAVSKINDPKTLMKERDQLTGILESLLIGTGETDPEKGDPKERDPAGNQPGTQTDETNRTHETGQGLIEILIDRYNKLTPVQQAGLNCATGGIFKVGKVLKIFKANGTVQVLQDIGTAVDGLVIGKDWATGQYYELAWDFAEQVPVAGGVASCIRVLDEMEQEKGEKFEAGLLKSSELEKNEVGPVEIPEDPALQQKHGAYGTGG
ncbi:hypothetical protein ACFU53_01275 [Streptomyces sp. NPDC057474]|uniref:hypothetical protein n=1 Tax=Streptomyces sp. NPDC057474 TaxID=3346144 RepID=UPI0036CEAA17